MKQQYLRDVKGEATLVKNLCTSSTYRTKTLRV